MSNNTDHDIGEFFLFVVAAAALLLAIAAHIRMREDRETNMNQITELQSQLKAEKSHADVKFNTCMNQFLNVNRKRNK